MSDIGSDPVATDAARYIRLPGSFRNDTEEYVEWHWAGKDEIPTYTLPELGDRFGVNQPAAPSSAKRVGTAGKCPQRRAGYDVANRGRLIALRKLQELRGGFTEGHTHVAGFMLAANLYWVDEALYMV